MLRTRHRGLETPPTGVPSLSVACWEITGRSRIVPAPHTVRRRYPFSELVRVLEKNGFEIVKEKGSIRYYGKPGCLRLIRIDYHGPKEAPTGACQSILKATGLK